MFDFPLAYFLVMLCVLAVNLTAVVVSSAGSFRASLRAAVDGDAPFCGRVFAAWDQHICKRSAVAILKQDIAGQLKVFDV